MNRFQPISITTVGLIAFLVWAWIGMSSMDYIASSGGDGRQTAGWFILGIPMLVPLAVLSTMPFSMVARRGRPVIAWSAMVLVFGMLIRFAYVQSTPQARLKYALGVELPAETTIVSLQETDSFNDGITTIGACTADMAMLEALVATHSLHQDISGHFISHYFRNVDIPEDGMGYQSDRLTCYYDRATGVLYFIRRYSDPRP